MKITLTQKVTDSEKSDKSYKGKQQIKRERCPTHVRHTICAQSRYQRNSVQNSIETNYNSYPGRKRAERLVEEHSSARRDPTGLLSKEQTLDWVRRYFAGMAEGTQPPMGTRSPPPAHVTTPKTQDQRTKALEEAISQIHILFREEISGIHNALRTLYTALCAGNAGVGDAGRVRGEQGRYNDHRGNRDQAFNNRDPVKAVGDMHRTMYAICQINKLSHAMLSDFDQWKQEMLNMIDSAWTNDPKYNWVNIELIYASIDLDLRDQAVGHEPSKMSMIHHVSPQAYLKDLEKLYTPADHLSAKRGKFEGRRQQPSESPMAYLSIMLILYNRAQYNDQNYLIETFLARLLNEALKLQIVLHHKTATDYKSMRAEVVECHAALFKAVRIGKGPPPFSVVGLTQQSDAASSETYAQWKQRTKTGNAKENDMMDLTQMEGITPPGSELLFFLGQDDLDLRDHETEEDLAYWEEELPNEDTTITKMVRGKAETTSKTCYHCNAVGHFKAQCPQ